MSSPSKISKCSGLSRRPHAPASFSVVLLLGLVVIATAAPSRFGANFPFPGYQASSLGRGRMRDADLEDLILVFTLQQQQQLQQLQQLQQQQQRQQQQHQLMTMMMTQPTVRGRNSQLTALPCNQADSDSDLLCDDTGLANVNGNGDGNGDDEVLLGAASATNSNGGVVVKRGPEFRRKRNHNSAPTSSSSSYL